MKKEELKNVSTEDLEKLLEERKKHEQKEAREKRAAYESKKDDLVKTLVNSAEEISHTLETFKKMSLEELESFYKLMHEYGDVAKTNKGNFSIKSADGLAKVEYKRQVNYAFDERATMADVKLKDFLSGFVKKKDNDAYELITSLLEKDKAGNYDPRLIQKLYKYEDRFPQQEWKDAIRLFKEAYQETNTATYIHFSRVNKNGRTESINLNFSSL